MTDLEEVPTEKKRRSAIVALVVLSVLALAALIAFAVTTGGSSSSRSAMSSRASQVMPFDLARTHHTFTKTDTGGIETVVADDPADARNTELIRSHLQLEAVQFKKGDFSDPAKIHGMDMPGLKELEAGAGRVDVRYRDVPAGAAIDYTSNEPSLITVLHSWFDRQASDHGMPGMGG